MSALEIRDVRRGYAKGTDVLRGITLEVGAGEVVALLGRNGAGKTTLLKIAMGLLRPSHGTVRALGLDPGPDAVELKRRIGYVSEEQVLPPDLTVSGALDIHRRLFPTWDAALESQLRDRFHLDPAASLGTLSKGQARQVSLVCAIAHRPELLLLDEPAGGLDPAARREILEAAVTLLSEAGSTILFSSHHMADVERIAGRVVLLHDGRVLLDGDLDEIREGYTLALLPAERAELEAIRVLAGFVRARRKTSTWHAVFSRPPQEVDTMLRNELGFDDAACRVIPLEDLFVEMVEGRS